MSLDRAAWDIEAMPEPQFDLAKIQDVLRSATAPGAKFSQRSLAKEAGEGRDAVGDILNGRNKNPTTKVLANLARALDSDLSLFGLAEERTTLPTEAELEQALLDALPYLPPKGLDKRARFLAANVAQILRLPSGRPTMRRDLVPDDGEAVPPPAPTS